MNAMTTDAIRNLAQAVVGSMQSADGSGAAEGASVVVRSVRPAANPGFVDVVLGSGDAEYTVQLAASDETAWLAVHLADGVQDFVSLEVSRGTSTPRCPGHGHPATAQVRDGAAVWVCPATGDPVRDIVPGGS